MLGKFGDIEFEVSDTKILNFEGFTRETSSVYENHQLIGQKPRTEFVAPGLDTVSFTVLLKAQAGVSPRDEMNRWVEYARSGNAERLEIGDKALGVDKWVVTNVSQMWETIFNQGELVGGKVDVMLQEYVETMWTVKGYQAGVQRQKEKRESMIENKEKNNYNGIGQISPGQGNYFNPVEMDFQDIPPSVLLVSNDEASAYRAYANYLNDNGMFFVGPLNTLGSESYITSLHMWLEVQMKEMHQVYDEVTPAMVASKGIHKVMRDVNTFADTSAIPDEDWDRLCAEFNRMILRLDYFDITSDLHYFRNKLNRTPEDLTALIRMNNKLNESRKWRLMPVSASIYHMFGSEGGYNLKFVSGCGKYEAVYDRNGVILTEKNDPLNMGTYNYAPSGELTDSALHYLYDVIPYEKYGNTPYDSPKDEENAFSNISKHDDDPDAQRYRKQIMIWLADTVISNP